MCVCGPCLHLTAQVPLPVDFDVPDVDAPAAPLPPAATAGLPGGVPVCHMLLGCGPHAAFKHLFAPGSELASRVAVAQVGVGAMAGAVGGRHRGVRGSGGQGFSGSRGCSLPAAGQCIVCAA